MVQTSSCSLYGSPQPASAGFTSNLINSCILTNNAFSENAHQLCNLSEKQSEDLSAFNLGLESLAMFVKMRMYRQTEWNVESHDDASLFTGGQLLGVGVIFFKA